MDVNITGYCEDSLTSRSTVEQCFILTFYGLSELSRKKQQTNQHQYSLTLQPRQHIHNGNDDAPCLKGFKSSKSCQPTGAAPRSCVSSGAPVSLQRDLSYFHPPACLPVNLGQELVKHTPLTVSFKAFQRLQAYFPHIKTIRCFPAFSHSWPKHYGVSSCLHTGNICKNKTVLTLSFLRNPTYIVRNCFVFLEHS